MKLYLIVLFIHPFIWSSQTLTCLYTSESVPWFSLDLVTLDCETAWGLIQRCYYFKPGFLRWSWLCLVTLMEYPQGREKHQEHTITTQQEEGVVLMLVWLRMLCWAGHWWQCDNPSWQGSSTPAHCTTDVPAAETSSQLHVYKCLVLISLLSVRDREKYKCN